jgi:hypothetical protein
VVVLGAWVTVSGAWVTVSGAWVTVVEPDPESVESDELDELGVAEPEDVPVDVEFPLQPASATIRPAVTITALLRSFTTRLTRLTHKSSDKPQQSQVIDNSTTSSKLMMDSDPQIIDGVGSKVLSTVP